MAPRNECRMDFSQRRTKRNTASVNLHESPHFYTCFSHANRELGRDLGLGYLCPYKFCTSGIVCRVKWTLCCELKWKFPLEGRGGAYWNQRPICALSSMIIGEYSGLQKIILLCYVQHERLVWKKASLERESQEHDLHYSHIAKAFFKYWDFKISIVCGLYLLKLDCPVSPSAPCHRHPAAIIFNACRQIRLLNRTWAVNAEAKALFSPKAIERREVSIDGV